MVAHKNNVKFLLILQLKLVPPEKIDSSCRFDSDEF